MLRPLDKRAPVCILAQHGAGQGEHSGERDYPRSVGRWFMLIAWLGAAALVAEAASAQTTAPPQVDTGALRAIDRQVEQIRRNATQGFAP
jgi:hypothetical protein